MQVLQNIVHCQSSWGRVRRYRLSFSPTSASMNALQVSVCDSSVPSFTALPSRPGLHYYPSRPGPGESLSKVLGESSTHDCTCALAVITGEHLLLEKNRGRTMVLVCRTAAHQDKDDMEEKWLPRTVRKAILTQCPAPRFSAAPSHGLIPGPYLVISPHLSPGLLSL